MSIRVIEIELKDKPFIGKRGESGEVVVNNHCPANLVDGLVVIPVVVPQLRRMIHEHRIPLGSDNTACLCMSMHQLRQLVMRSLRVMAEAGCEVSRQSLNALLTGLATSSVALTDEVDAAIQAGLAEFSEPRS